MIAASSSLDSEPWATSVNLVGLFARHAVIFDAQSSSHHRLQCCTSLTCMHCTLCLRFLDGNRSKENKCADKWCFIVSISTFLSLSVLLLCQWYCGDCCCSDHLLFLAWSPTEIIGHHRGQYAEWFASFFVLAFGLQLHLFSLCTLANLPYNCRLNLFIWRCLRSASHSVFAKKQNFARSHQITADHAHRYASSCSRSAHSMPTPSSFRILAGLGNFSFAIIDTHIVSTLRTHSASDVANKQIKKSHCNHEINVTKCGLWKAARQWDDADDEDAEEIYSQRSALDTTLIRFYYFVFIFSLVSFYI